jgi:drug/metabolite transporter (DMT)-like permease
MWWGEKLNRYGIFGICLGFFGSLILILTTSRPEEAISSWWIFSLPEIAAVSAVVISRYGWINIQRLVTKEQYTPSEINSLMMLCGGVYALILAHFKHEISMVYFDWHIVGLLLYTILIGNVIGYTMIGHFLKQYSVTTVSLAGLSVPLFVQLFGTLYLHEPINPVFFIAFGCMSIGLYIFQTTRKQ